MLRRRGFGSASPAWTRTAHATLTSSSDPNREISNAAQQQREIQDQRVRLLESIKECGRSGDLHHARTLHREARDKNLHSSFRIATSLVDMYGKCGSLADAQAAFDASSFRDVILWTALIMSYAENREGQTALQLIACMDSDGCHPNPRTYVAAFLACSSLAVKEEETDQGRSAKVKILEQGMNLHSEAERKGFTRSMFVANSLLDMYMKCGSPVDARAVFDKMVEFDVVSWTALIVGYADNSESEVALSVFRCMQDFCCVPNHRTYIAALKACGNSAALTSGREIHAEVCRCGLEEHEFVAASLVDFYGKCASMIDAKRVFDGIHTCDLTTWSSLMSGYSRQGDSKSVLTLFEMMENENAGADKVVLLAVLTACSHCGRVEKGREVFEDMEKRFGIRAGIQHYTCMVDMLSRFNRVEEAAGLVRGMPVRADAVIWTTLLGGCQKWKNVEVGRVAFEALVRLEEQAVAYVLMANIYGSVGLWGEKAEILARKRDLDMRNEQMFQDC